MLQCEILNSREGNMPHAGQNGKKGKIRIRKKVLYSKLMNIKADYKIFFLNPISMVYCVNCKTKKDTQKRTR
jgi:hypothetical protein